MFSRRIEKKGGLMGKCKFCGTEKLNDSKPCEECGLPVVEEIKTNKEKIKVVIKKKNRR